MAKVIVYEDSVDDFIDRYQSLTGAHDVHLRAEGMLRGLFGEEHMRDFQLDKLVNAGFSRENVGLGDVDNIEDADVYFVDGLMGNCFAYLNVLPKDRTFLNSGDPFIVGDARAKGFNILERETTPEDAVREVVSRDSN